MAPERPTFSNLISRDLLCRSETRGIIALNLPLVGLLICVPV